MAQLLSPSAVFTEVLKFQNPLPNGCSRTPWRMLAKPSSSLTSMGGHGGGGRRRRGLGRLRVATDGSPSTDAVADDYYSVLGLPCYNRRLEENGGHRSIFNPTADGHFTFVGVPSPPPLD